MNKLKLLALMLVLTLGLAGCKPDLVIQDKAVGWTDDKKEAKAVIANIGDADAGEFMVYFNGEENPESPNHRPQVSHRVNSLAKGEYIDLYANFTELAHPDNHNLANVYMIRILVDPKETVNESNENNNEATLAVGGQEDCIDFEQQTLATVYNVSDVFTDEGVQISLRQFDWGNNNWTTGGHATIENSLYAGYTGQEIGVNNINLEFDFGGTLNGLSLYFGEYGGNLNIRVNGVFQNFDNFATINGTTIGGATVAVINGNGNDKGFLELSGTIDSFEIGGQELWIDHVCKQ